MNSTVPTHSDTTAEVALGIEVSGSVLFRGDVGRPANIRVYWSTDSGESCAPGDSGWMRCSALFRGARMRLIGNQQMPSIWKRQQKAAAEAGMVLFAGSGDNDSNDGGPNLANVDLPASCPHFIGCGELRKPRLLRRFGMTIPGRADGSGTGGGFSTIFTPLPNWQIGAPNGPGRMVPDVAANADPNTGYNIVVHGTTVIRGGTSAVAPLYAGLFAAFGRKLGYVTPKLWLNPLCFSDITVGDNGAFRADHGQS